MTKQIVTQCSVDRCERVEWARQLCGKHYQRWRKFGNPLITHSTRPDISFEEWFWQQIKVDEQTECWIWQLALATRGYGQVSIKRKSYRAHRIAYELFYKESAKGKLVCHTCDNPPCINPHHLFLGTAKENTQDMIQKSRHYHGERHHFAKLTAQAVLDMRNRHAKGDVTIAQLAREYGISEPSANRVIAGITWRHV